LLNTKPCHLTTFWTNNIACTSRCTQIRVLLVYQR
jgi:hypothetical protein